MHTMLMWCFVCKIIIVCSCIYSQKVRNIIHLFRYWVKVFLAIVVCLPEPQGKRLNSRANTVPKAIKRKPLNRFSCIIHKFISFLLRENLFQSLRDAFRLDLEAFIVIGVILILVFTVEMISSVRYGENRLEINVCFYSHFFFKFIFTYISIFWVR